MSSLPNARSASANTRPTSVALHVALDGNGLAAPLDDLLHDAVRPRLVASASSSLDFGVESFQFHAGVLDAELPIDAALLGVGLGGPDGYLSLQFGHFADAA